MKRVTIVKGIAIVKGIPTVQEMTSFHERMSFTSQKESFNTAKRPPSPSQKTPHSSKCGFNSLPTLPFLLVEALV